MKEVRTGVPSRLCSVCKSPKRPLFKFPKDINKREAWREFFGLKSATTFMQVCSSHFRAEDVKTRSNGQYQLGRNAFPLVKIPESANPSQRSHTHQSNNPRCIVPRCGKLSTDGVSLHHFPRFYERRHQWATLINLKRVPSRHNYICSSHFFPTDFHINGAQKLLKSCATPSINLVVSVTTSNEVETCHTDSKGDTSIAVISGVPMSNNEETRPEQMQSDNLRDSAEPSCQMGLMVVNRDTHAVSDNEESLEDEGSSPGPHNQRKMEDSSVPSCSHDVTSLEVESDKGHSFDKVLSNTTDINDAEALLSVFKRLSHNLTDDIDYIVSSPSGSCNTSVNSQPSFSSYNESCTQTETCEFDIFHVLHTDTQLKALTGVNFVTLNCLLKLLLELCGDIKDAQVPMKKKLFLTLCKLRLNLSYECLSVLVGIDRRNCGRYFFSTLHLLAVVLQHTVTWPSKEETAFNMPKCFRKFTDTRVILDCLELPVITPDCSKCRIRFYSHYKGGQTAQILVGIAPSGLIIFVSEVYGGCASDKEIFEKSDLLSKLEPHVDAVMAEKGFNIDDVCNESGIQVHRFPFVVKKQPLNEDNAKRSSEIANARVHVKRVIQRIKIFKILQSRVSWSMVPYLNEIVVVVAGLVNLGPPILSDDKFMTYKKV